MAPRMNTHITTRPDWSRLRRTATGAVAALALVACSPSDVLDVEDPDIISPSNVQSAAGADAVRVGALARLNTATSGDESLFLLGGLFADEWINGDSFIYRQHVDQRVMTPENSFLDDANRALHRARLSAIQAIPLLQTYKPTGPAWQVAEMYFVQGFVENLLAEHYCNGLVFSTVVDGTLEYGQQITTEAAFELALEHVDAGLALLPASATTADDNRVRNALQLTRGRILLNLNRPAEAAAAVAGVPTSYAYEMFHSQTTNDNAFWTFNLSSRRYSVGDVEGGTGMDFVSANDPRVPVCAGGDTECDAIGVTAVDRDDKGTPFHVQRLWTTRGTTVAILQGVEARLIEAEAQLAANPGAALTILNDARATVPGLTPLADAGTPEARVDQLFRERAFWLFGRGHRVGDMRRLIRQYSRSASTVFPTGDWHKGGSYGPDVNMPVPQSEQNNPNAGAGTCLDRDA